MKNVFYIFLLLTISACTEKIDFDLSDQVSYLVVDGLLTDELKEHEVHLTRTSSFYDKNKPAGVRNALVTLSDGNGNWVLSEREPGFYYTPVMQGEVGKTYTLSILSGDESYTASDYMGRITNIDSAYVVKRSVPFELRGQSDLYSIFMLGSEPEGVGDFYLWQYDVRKPGETEWVNKTDSFQHWSYAPDNFVDGNNPKDGYEVFAFLDSARMPSNVEVRLHFFSISKEYFRFCSDMSKQTFRGGPFDGPQANVSTNVSGSGLGFFRVSAKRSFITRNPE